MIHSDFREGRLRLFEEEVVLPDQLALHICCAPCAQWPLEFLRAHGVEPALLFFNPNIHPQSEWIRRKESVEAFAEKEQVELEIRGESQPDCWIQRHAQSRSECCRFCYATRLEQTAQFACEKGLKAFGTTLLISPYQNHDAIHQVGQTIAKRYGLLYCAFDFTPGFRRSQRLARSAGYYCQKYCGCLYSLKESDFAQRLAAERGVILLQIPDRAQERDK